MSERKSRVNMHGGTNWQKWWSVYCCQLTTMTTMTTTIDSFFAPERNIDYRASDKPLAWKSLFSSSVAHIVGFAIVILMTQIDLEKKKSQAPTSPEVLQAVLYTPSIKVQKLPAKSESNAAKPIDALKETTLPADVNNNTHPVKEVTATTDKPQDVIHSAAESSNTEPPSVIEPVPNQQQPTNANQRAGRLNLSAKGAANQYFNSYNSQQIESEASFAAREYQQRRNSPNIIDPRKGEDIPDTPPRPVKRVNCSSTTNKTLAILSGITGGTLECTKMDDHNRFIDARLKKRSNEGR